MRCRLKRAALLVLCAALALPTAGASPAPQRGGDCLSGNCASGVGTVRVAGAEYTGDWRNSNFVAGRYSVAYAAYPGKDLKLVVDTDGFPVEGSIHHAMLNDTLHSPSLYTGSFARVWSPFSRSYVPRFAKGRYSDVAGIVYEGDFDFVPGLLPGYTTAAAAGGYYIFQGVRIDEEADEVRPGLYISDWTTAETHVGKPPTGHRVRFHRARPDYIAKLQDDLRADLQKANAEEAAKLAELAKERESRESWSNLFTLAIGVAVVVGVAQLASRSSSSSSAVSALGDTLAGKQAAPAASNRMVNDLRERAKTAPDLAKRIGNASDAQVADLLQQAGRTPPAKMTVTEYRHTATQASTTTAVAQTPQAAQPEPLIVERNPYVVDQSPSRWRDKMVNPWRNATGLSPGSGRTRVDACTDATLRGNNTIKNDRATGVVRPTAPLSDCVCHNSGSASEIRRLWICHVYYQYELK